MAKRPSVKEILELARKGGPAKPAEAEPSAPEAEEAAAPPLEEGAGPVAEEPAASEPAPAAAAAPRVNVPTPSSLGRPLTLKEKLAAARAGGAARPAAAAPAPAAAPPAETPAAPAEEAQEPPAAEERRAVPAPAKPLGRPLTLQEKLAAARGGGAKPPAPAGAAKPAAAKPAAATAVAAKSAATRTLPPLEKMTDPRDLAEAARQAAARRAKELAAKAAAAAPAKPAAKAAPAKPQTVPPRPTRELAEATAAPEEFSRRGFFVGSLFITWTVAWITVAWTTFTAALSAMTLMTVRFMFPNVLAEPPSTIKIGLPSNYESEEVSERFKVEWGFWVVRHNYNGQDVIYALQSVCTHLGCPPNWLAAEQKFKCPCHGSGFYISGINFEGPAPRPLERFKVVLADDGQVMVDKSQRFQQELGQWSDPDSFIAT
jgi:cytochrome b6-f complex iron-sulfur subunit